MNAYEVLLMLDPELAEEKANEVIARMREQVESIVSSVVGEGRARVQLVTELDFNRITQTSDRFDPESRVVRSSQTREEMSAAGDSGAAAPVSAGNDLPGGNPRQGEAAPTRDQNRKSEEIVNYEIGRAHV